MYTILFVINNKEKYYCEGDYKYAILDDGTVEIIEYIGNETEIEIPSELGSMPVSRLGNINCFYNIRFNENTIINIPDTVTAIEQDMFEVYHDVRIYIPSSVTSIGYGYDDDGKNGEIIYDIDYATLVVESGSYAESYAKKMNIKYEVVDSVQALYEAAVASEAEQ